MKEPTVETDTVTITGASGTRIEAIIKVPIQEAIRFLFTTDVDKRWPGGVTEIINPAFVPAGGPNGTLIIRSGADTISVSRYVSPKTIGDIDAMRSAPDQFEDAVKATVSDYVKLLPQTITHASVPSIFLERAGFCVSWFLYGYAGTIGAATPQAPDVG